VAGRQTSGGQAAGTKGKHLAQVADPDAVLTHASARCRDCGADLAETEVICVERRQVFERPEVKAHVTDHHMKRRRCVCGRETRHLHPEKATAPAFYGPGVCAPGVYLAVYQHLPYDRMAQLFADVVGIEWSVLAAGYPEEPV
jgi:transposase